MNTYPVGSVVQVSTADSSTAGFVSYATGSAVLTDPTTIELVVTINEGTPIVFTATWNGATVSSTVVASGSWPLQSSYPVNSTGPTITRISTGLYTAVLPTQTPIGVSPAVSLPGEWIYEWQGAGSIVAVKPNSFLVTSYPN